MFGTVIMDAYRQSETEELAVAIDDLCNPNDSYGWASAGIYCFWDYYAEEVLYLGLAGDLAERFKQHNGILPLKQGSKQAYIEKYNTFFPIHITLYFINKTAKLRFRLFQTTTFQEGCVVRLCAGKLFV